MSKSKWDSWSFWSPADEPLPKDGDITRHRKISICTNCMGRTNDLRRTYLKNIADNLDYPDIEFVLLNYNSKDDMDEWVKRYLSPFIEDGIVNYYKTTEPEFYEMGHSRNVQSKLAQGDIINNVDADNYAGFGFADAINKLAELKRTKAVFCKGKRMMHGRFGMYKREFMEVGGYDEDLTGYGYDDHWVMDRAMARGYKMMWWTGVPDNNFMRRIKTPRNLVGVNMREKSWKKTERANQELAEAKLAAGDLTSNIDRHWGKATVIKNFGEEISI